MVGIAGQSAAADPPPVGPLLIDEDFTGATAIAGFSGYGTACLTGADEVPSTLPGPALGGCTDSSHPGVATWPTVEFPTSPPLDSAGHGYLRLTDALPDQVGAVLYDTPIRATEGVAITFDMWQYGGYSTIGAFQNVTADGISFFLVDAAQVGTLSAPGAFGGSLGYAQKRPDGDPANDIVPGVDGGYLGFGFDALGNFFGDWEDRGHGCDVVSPAGTAFQIPAPGPNMITVRGPGQGEDGYCFLDATYQGTAPNFTSTLDGDLHGDAVGPVVTDAAAAETYLEPSKRTVTMVLQPEPVHTITVLVDYHDGAGPQEELSVPAPEPMPAAVKLGFAASTGAFTDVHLIRTLRVQAIYALPSMSLAKAVKPEIAGFLEAGDWLAYTFTVTNTGGRDISDVTIEDPLVTDVTCPSSDLLVGKKLVCTGRYQITAADAERGSVHNVAVAHGSDPTGDPVDSPEATADADLVALAPTGFDSAQMALPALAILVLGFGALAASLRTRRAN